MPEREAVTAQRLAELLNQELAKYAACRDCQFNDRILELQEPDETGCNWSDDLIIRCSGRSIGYHCVRAVVGVVQDARDRYNLLSDRP
jgi:hypothetical protein